jgi:hypothetical protein
MQSKLLDLDACPTPSHPPAGFVAQPTNQSLLDFDAQTKKPLWWFWGPNHQTVAAGFEAQTGKPSTTLVLSLNQEIITTGFEAKPEKPIRVVLRPNHWQTVNLGFEAQPRNLRSSSPHSRCRPHTASPDLPIIRPPSTRLVWPSPVLCTRSPTPAMILVAANHATPATCTPRDKKMWFFKRTKDKGKTTELSQIQIETSPSQWLITIKPRSFSCWITDELIKVWVLPKSTRINIDRPWIEPIILIDFGDSTPLTASSDRQTHS